MAREGDPGIVGSRFRGEARELARGDLGRTRQEVDQGDGGGTVEGWRGVRADVSRWRAEGSSRGRRWAEATA